MTVSVQAKRYFIRKAEMLWKQIICEFIRLPSNNISFAF